MGAAGTGGGAGVETGRVGSRIRPAGRTAGALLATLVALAGSTWSAFAAPAADGNGTPPPEPAAASVPPRSISDITAILDQEHPDPARVAAARTAAEAQPPARLTGARLSGFYFKRATAAGGLGRERQRLEDLRRAVDLIAPYRDRYTRRYLLYAHGLALAEARSGHPRTALGIGRELLRLEENTEKFRGRLIADYLTVVQNEVRFGRLRAARALLARADALLAQSRAWPQASARHGHFRALVGWMHAVVLGASGRYAEAGRAFRRALREQESAIAASAHWHPAPAPGVLETARDLMRRDLALNLVRQGRLIDAEVEQRRALLDQLRLRGRYASESNIMVAALGYIVGEQGRYAEAEQLDRVAVETYLRLGHAPDSFALAAARTNLLTALVARRRWSEAAAQLDLVRAGLASDPRALQRVLGRNPNVVMAALRAGRTAEALSVVKRALKRHILVFGPDRYETAEVRGLYARALAASGRGEEALAAYREAAPGLLQASRRADEESDSPVARDLRLRYIVEGYLEFLAARVRAGDAGAASESFRIADAGRGRAVQRALAASLARSAVRDPVLATLVRREQDARRQSGALQALLVAIYSVPSGEQDAGEADALRKRIGELRAERRALRQQVARRFPGYRNLIEPAPRSVEPVRAALAPGEALLATYVGEQHTYLWAFQAGGPVAFATVAPGRDGLAASIGALRGALEPDASTLGGIPRFDVALAHRLYAELLEPVRSGWQGAKSLLVVPDGPLGQLPLALLVTAPAAPVSEQPGDPPFSGYRRVPWLARSMAVTQLPSVASLSALRAVPLPPAGRKPFVGFGDPWFSRAQAAAESRAAAAPARGAAGLRSRGVAVHLRSKPATARAEHAGLAVLPPLPETAAEVREVAAALGADPRKDVYTGARASVRTVRSLRLDDRRVVMFATHGLLPGDLDGLVEPALALSSPRVVGGGGDGLLTMSGILGLHLDADWVVLSACDTAAGDGAGAEAVSGLGLAFFYAGTRAVLVSNWPVETTSARALTTGLFRYEAEHPGVSRAEALRAAMMELVDGPGARDPATGRTLFSYAHPIFWAPFSLVGDGGRPRP